MFPQGAEGNAVCSVASLEWVWRMNDSSPQASAKASGASHSETISAKEDKDIREMPGKTPRLLF